MITLTDKNFKEEVLEADTPVLVDYYADWCGPCIMLGPIIEEVAKEFEGKIKVGKLNVDENRQTASQYQIMSIPTLIIFKDGKIVERLTGLQSKEILVDKINSLL